jgi:hypothetical protein
MAGTITLGDYTVPFDEELFLMYFDDEPDLVGDVFAQSGIMVEDAVIANLIKDGSNYYTIPFYGALADDDDQNYDGKTNILLSTMGATKQSGVVYGRAHGWYADDFVADFTAANPLQAIAARVRKYWLNKRQARMLGITNAVLGVAEMAPNVGSAAELTPNTFSDFAQQVWGDHKGVASLAIMHSAVAQAYEDMERVDYRKYTDAQGVQRSLNVYELNGMTVLLDDSLPKTAASQGNPATYTSYVFAEGALRHAEAPVDHPTFFGRDELTRGGMEYFGNRFRETIHPNGFDFTLPVSDGKPVVSPTDAQLAASANWSLAFSDPKMIPFAKIVTPGV